MLSNLLSRISSRGRCVISLLRPSLTSPSQRFFSVIGRCNDDDTIYALSSGIGELSLIVS